MQTQDLRPYIEQIKASMPVDEWVSCRVPVRRGAGRNTLVMCPICNSDSFDHARAKAEYYKCYSTKCPSGNRAMDIIDTAAWFLHKQPAEGEIFTQVVKELAKECGIVIPEAGTDQTDPRQRTRMIHRKALEYYQKQLQMKPEALEYLAKRGVTSDQIAQYKIGYAPGGRSLLNHLTRQGFTKEEVVASGLATERGYDLLWNAVVVDVHSNRGGTIYGRSIDPEADKKDRHRYLTGRSQYGLFGMPYRARTLLLSEGIFDDLAQKNAIAKAADIVRRWSDLDPDSATSIDWDSIGSAATYGTCGFREEYIEDLKKAGVEEVILTADSDGPGLEAARKYAAMLEPHFTVRIAIFPNGEDPNSILMKPEHGLNQWVKAILRAISPVELDVELILRRYNLKQPTDRVLAAQDIARTLQNRNAVVRAIMAERVAEKLQVPVDAVMQMIDAIRSESLLASSQGAKIA